MKKVAFPSLFLIGVAALLPVARAQVQITGISYGTLVDSANTNNRGNNNLDFQNQYAPVNTVSTSTTTYRFDGPTATSIVTRRNTSEAGPNNTTVFYQVNNGSASNPLGNYDASVQDMFLGANLMEGLRNPFANGAGAQNSNIERIDFLLPNYVVGANDALVFFDLEDTGNRGDGFRIAAYTSVGTVNGFTNAPTAYAGNGLLVAPDSFGPAVNSPTAGTNGYFERVTYTNGDDLSGTVSNGNISNIGNGLNLVGILIRLTDLGITAGTTIQGFSLMGADVNPSAVSGTDLVNWNNTSVYLNNTSAAGVGNMDFMAFGATVAKPVPEPSVYGAILIAAALGGWWVRRRQLELVRVKV